MLGKRSVLILLAVLGSFPEMPECSGQDGMQILRNFVSPIVPKPPPQLHHELQRWNRRDL